MTRSARKKVTLGPVAAPAQKPGARSQGLAWLRALTALWAPRNNPTWAAHAQRKGRWDEVKLWQMGYKQELSRRWTFFNNAGCTFSVMSFYAVVESYSLQGLTYGGPVIVIWSWIVVAFFSLCIACCLAELVSAFPTSGGLYYWSFVLAPPRWRAFACWITGWLNLLGQVAFTAGTEIVLAHFISTLVYMHTIGADGSPGYELNRNEDLLVFAGLIVSHSTLNCITHDWTSYMVSAAALWHIVANTGFCLVLVLVAPTHQSNSFVWREWTPNTEVHGISNPAYIALAGLLMAQWNMLGYDASVHMCEETIDADNSVSWAMVAGVAGCSVFGLGWLLTLTYSMQSLDNLFNTESVTGGVSGIAQLTWDIFEARYGSGRGAIPMLYIPLVGLWFCCLTAMLSNGRMIYAFSRDGAMLGAGMWKRLGTPWHDNQLPVAGTWFMALLAFLVGLPSLFNYQALIATSACCVTALTLSYGIPIALRLLHGSDGFIPGPFRLGKWFPLVGSLACGWILFVSIAFLLPMWYPITDINMNYAVVMLVAVMAFAMFMWWAPGFGGVHWFHGPHPNCHVGLTEARRITAVSATEGHNAAEGPRRSESSRQRGPEAQELQRVPSTRQPRRSRFSIPTVDDDVLLCTKESLAASLFVEGLYSTMNLSFDGRTSRATGHVDESMLNAINVALGQDDSSSQRWSVESGFEITGSTNQTGAATAGVFLQMPNQARRGSVVLSTNHPHSGLATMDQIPQRVHKRLPNKSKSFRHVRGEQPGKSLAWQMDWPNGRTTPRGISDSHPTVATSGGEALDPPINRTQSDHSHKLLALVPGGMSAGNSTGQLHIPQQGAVAAWPAPVASVAAGIGRGPPSGPGSSNGRSKVSMDLGPRSGTRLEFSRVAGQPGIRQGRSAEGGPRGRTPGGVSSHTPGDDRDASRRGGSAKGDPRGHTPGALELITTSSEPPQARPSIAHTPGALELMASPSEPRQARPSIAQHAQQGRKTFQEEPGMGFKRVLVRAALGNRPRSSERSRVVDHHPSAAVQGLQPHLSTSAHDRAGPKLTSSSGGNPPAPHPPPFATNSHRRSAEYYDGRKDVRTAGGVSDVRRALGPRGSENGSARSSLAGQVRAALLTVGHQQMTGTGLEPSSRQEATLAMWRRTSALHVSMLCTQPALPGQPPGPQSHQGALQTQPASRAQPPGPQSQQGSLQTQPAP